MNEPGLNEPVLKVDKLSKFYPVHQLWRQVGTVRALNEISFTLGTQETLAVVGESGCGKSTLAKLLMQIERPTSGAMIADGKPAGEMADYHKFIQMIFQDPYSSINPRKRAWQIIGEPLLIQGMPREQVKAKAELMMSTVGIRPEYAGRYPHMFSGDQRQRIGIARALMVHPRVVICDEPVSALDVSVQAQIINLLVELQKQHRLSYIFISHDLSVVRYLADRVLVIYLGKVVEFGSRDQIFNDPQHPYTRILLASSPRVEVNHKKPLLISGELPSRLNPPAGCAFHQRCASSTDLCREQAPELMAVGERQVACHHLGAKKHGH